VKLVPLTVKVAAVPAVPAVVVPRLSVLGVTVTVGVGTALTVPVAATFCAVAPVLVSVMLPVTGPCAAAELMRALMVVVATVPDVGVSVTVPEKGVPPLGISQSFPTRRSSDLVKLVPLTVKVTGVPAVPAVVVPKVSELGVTVTVG